MKRVLLQNLIRITLGLIIIASSSCVNLKKVQLMQEKSITDYSQEIINAQRDAYKINFGDHLYIKIFSTDAQTSRFFKSDFPDIMTNSYVYLNSYKVDEEGFVNYSFVGKIKVKGLTINEAQKAIEESLQEYFKDVNVYAKLVNFNITVLGEVNSQGTYTVDQEEITILQALGLAGGFTDFGHAEKVVLVRKSPNGSTVKYIDLTDNGVLQAEHLFLMPDDVIYVAPRGSKSFVFDKFPYGLFFGIISMALSIYAITTD
ncbi:MAG: polysaccharide export protein [Marinilabiliaceae bacterium]|nr:polysaccharide export protein [Marinilabiliaceae bacterium]